LTAKINALLSGLSAIDRKPPGHRIPSSAG
jgi:hypothetical protein